MSTATTTIPPPAVLDTMIRVIMSQTEMTEEETRAALERTKYDLKRVIREYMAPSSAATTTTATAATIQSTNQLRFAEIRNFMDKSADEYYRRQEYAKIYNEVLERKKAAAAGAAAIETTATEAAVSKL